ncbi:MAG: hypothetical protein ACI9HK_002931 [Pirellulaceae bacterium]|jgi:hypothetical protein
MSLATGFFLCVTPMSSVVFSWFAGAAAAIQLPSLFCPKAFSPLQSATPISLSTDISQPREVLSV